MGGAGGGAKGGTGGAGERFSTETDLGWLHGKPGAGRSVDRLRDGPAERRARGREEEPRAAPRRGESRVPHPGRGRTPVRPCGPRTPRGVLAPGEADALRLPITLLVSGDSA